MADRDRIRAVVGQMRLDEKIALTQIRNGTLTRACASLKVPSLTFTEEFAPLNLRQTPFVALGAAFDLDLARETGNAVSCRAAVNGAAFGGTVPVGIVRSPYLESDAMGEDPTAVSKLTAAYCADACLPFVADALFTEGVDRQFDPRALHEMYLKPYNDNRERLGGVIVPCGAVNGGLCAGSAFTTELDKSKPVFVRGHELADPLEAVGGGAFLTLGESPADASAAYAAIRDGKLYEGKLDRLLEPFLDRCVEYNEFRKNVLPSVEPPDYEDVTMRLAERSTVMLTNDGTLPVDDFCVVSDRTIFVGLNGQPTSRMIKKAAKYVRDNNALLILHIDGAVTDRQKKLTAAVCASAHTTTVVLVCTHAVETDFLEQANAVLFAPLFDYGTIERIVRGEYSPSGRLPFTWAARETDYPSAIKRGNRECYAFESVYVGYRYFDAFGVRPAFPFGHGLGYLDVRVTPGKATVKDDVVRIAFTAENRSRRAGDYVLLAFAQLPDAAVFGVERRLAAFGRVSFTGAGKIDGELTVDTRDLCVYDPTEGFVLVGGKYTFEVEGATSVECKIGKKVKIKGYGKSDVPSYYPSSNFNPLGVEVEKLLGAKAFSGQSELHEYLRLPTKPEPRLYARICKRYAIPREDRPRVYRLLGRLPQYALYKAAGVR